MPLASLLQCLVEWNYTYSGQINCDSKLIESSGILGEIDASWNQAEYIQRLLYVWIKQVTRDGFVHRWLDETFSHE
jgi:hypothetical protein